MPVQQSLRLRLGGVGGGPKYVVFWGLGKAENLEKPAAERSGANPFQVIGALAVFNNNL